MLRIGATRPWLVWLLTSPSRLTQMSNLSTNTDPGPLHFETDASGKLMAARARCARGQLGRVPPVDFVVRRTAVKDGPRIALSPRSKRLARLPDAMSALRSGGKLA